MKSSDDALGLLQKLATQKSRDKRNTECLKTPERSHEDKDEWFIYVPSCFNDCLDIERTDRVVRNKRKKVWTQGSRFAFHRGCTLYDTPRAYDRWGDAANHIKFCISVRRGEAAEPSTKEKERKPGTVEFSVFSPSTRSACLKEIGTFELTQDEFIKFLIEGNPQIVPIERIA